MFSIKEEKKSSFLFYIFLLLIAMTSLHFGAALAKNLFAFVGAEGSLTLRQLIGTIILLIIFKPWKNNLKNKSKLSLIIYGLSLGAMNYLFYISLKTVPLGIAVSLEFSGPLIITILSSRRLIDFFWLALAVIGLITLLPLKLISLNGIDPTGACYALGAGLFWAIYIIFGKKSAKIYGSGSVAMGSLIATIVFCPIAIWHNQGYYYFQFIDVIPIGFVIALLSTVIPYSLEIIALPKMSIKIFGMLMSLEPVIAVLSGILFLKEKLNFTQCIALTSIIIASSGAALTHKSKSENLK